MNARICSGLACLLWVNAVTATVDPAVQKRLAALAVPFVPNAGQWDAEVAFAAHTFGGTLFVAVDGRLVYRLPRTAVTGASWVLTETLVDTPERSLRPALEGRGLQGGKVSYAIGNDESRHRDGLPTFLRVSLGEVYPGISVELRASGSNVEKIFTVSPRHDPAAIRVRLDGAQQLEIGEQGELIAHTGNGPVRFTAPIAYQESATGKRSTVPVSYVLDAAKRGYGFEVAAYDKARPLIIDPLLQSTYLGGSGADDTATALAIHPASGEVYVAGYTSSTDFPKVAGAEQTTNAGGTDDAFVTRLNAALTVRLQSTYIGGNGNDRANALAIHPASGEVYVAGNTSSTNFPKVAGAEQTTNGGGTSDAFVTRLNAALTARLQSTYLGGSGNDLANALAIHPASGEVYVAGHTSSTNFPEVAGAEQTTNAGGTNDAFVTRLNAALTARLQSTYLGGIGNDQVKALAIHPASGEVYVAGYTSSTNFPKVAGAEQTTHAGGTNDAFVTRLNAPLTVRLQSTYLGGIGSDQVNALAIHPASGEVYVAGYTDSANFPKVAGAEQATYGGGGDAFVTRLTATLVTRLQSTYVGGSGFDEAIALAIHPATGDVYIAGGTDSTDFPKVAAAEQPSRGGLTDGFVSRLTAALTARLQSTYLGDINFDEVLALAIHTVTGDIYVAGTTNSTDFPKVAGAEQATNAGSFDAFVSRYTLDLLAADVVPNAFTFPPKLNVPVGSQQTSAPAQITGIVGNVRIALTGGNFAQYCTSSSSGCACDVLPYGNAAATINNNQFVCVRQNAPLTAPAVAQAVVVVGGGYGRFFVTTGTLISGCSIDIDGNGTVDALTDGLLLMRAAFGLTGTAVTHGAVGGGATRTTWAQIQTYLNGNCGTSFAP